MKFLVTAMLVATTLVSGSLSAMDLFRCGESMLAQSGVPAHETYQIQLTDNLFEIPIGTKLILNLPDKPGYSVIHDQKMIHSNGDTSWFGYLDDFQKGFRVYLIKGGDNVRGQISTPEGEYRIVTKDSGVFLQNMKDKLLFNGSDDIEHVFVPGAIPAERKLGSSPESADDRSMATIDIMVLYNPDMMDTYPGSQLQTRINQLIALSNQAFTDSNVYIQYNLVHTEMIDVPNTMSNPEALGRMTNGMAPFDSMDSLRRQKGADLVTLLRPFSVTAHGNCGTAWLNGEGGQDISIYSNTGFSAVSDGADGENYCGEYSFTHELGHNLGCAHDRDHSNTIGAYPYSFGHDISGPNAFGTIMSYDGPTLGFFSNPDISRCNGQPCGVPASESGAANNALSMNNTRHAVAAFMQTSDNGLSGNLYNITGLSINRSSGPEVDETFTVKVNVYNPSNQILYYRFYFKDAYGTPSYDTTDWMVLQDYSTSNALNISLAWAADYIMVVRVVPDPRNEPAVLPIIGQALSVGNQGKVFINGLSSNQSGRVTTQVPLTFTVNAATNRAEPIYYSYYYRANYGTPSYDLTPWTLIQGYSTSKSCQVTFPNPGDYVVVARAVTNPSAEPAALPICGTVVHVE